MGSIQSNIICAMHKGELPFTRGVFSQNIICAMHKGVLAIHMGSIQSEYNLCHAQGRISHSHGEYSLLFLHQNILYCILFQNFFFLI